MASKDSSMDDMVKAVSSNPAYKVLTKEEYDILMSKHAGGSPKKADPKVLTSTPDAKKVQFEGAGSKLLSFINKGQAPSPVPRFTFNNTLPHNTSYVPSPYVPKLPTFSGSEEPQKGETTYEVWSLEVKCLQSSSVLPEPILLQSIRNSLKGSARSLLVPLGQNATVADILAKLDGFYANVSSSETLIQSFYSDYQKEAESVVSFASRIEQTLSRAVKSGHIDGIAKDAMLRSKFWTGLKSQSLKNSTRHLYDTIKDFLSLLREIRKVDQEENSFKQTKKPTAQQQQCNQVTSDSENNTDVLLKSMKELMSRMEKMEERLDQQTKQSSESVGQSNFPDSYSYSNQYVPRGCGRAGYRSNFQRGGCGRGYQGSSNHNNHNSNNSYNNAHQNNYSQRGNRGGGGSWRGHRGGSNCRGTNHGENAGNHLNF